MVVVKNETFATYVLSKLSIALTVTNHIAIGNINFGIVHVFADKPCLWFPCCGTIFREMAVNELLVETDPLIF